MNRRTFFQKLGLFGIGVAAVEATNAMPIPEKHEQQMLLEFFETQVRRLSEGKDIDVRSLMENLHRVPAGIRWHYMRSLYICPGAGFSTVNESHQRLRRALEQDKELLKSIQEWRGIGKR